MKTPTQTTYRVPCRFTTSNEPSAIDWSDILENGEAIASAEITFVRGDTIADRISTVDNVTTYWLSGGTAAPAGHQYRIDFTNSFGDTVPSSSRSQSPADSLAMFILLLAKGCLE